MSRQEYVYRCSYCGHVVTIRRREFVENGGPENQKWEDCPKSDRSSRRHWYEYQNTVETPEPPRPSWLKAGHFAADL